MTFWKWSQTPASNATADSTINWAEGQAPSSVNDSARAMMAAASKYRDDTSGAIVATGTASAYVVTTNQVFDTLAHLRTNEIVFLCPATNAAGVTLNVDGLGAQAINGVDGNAIPAGTLIFGGVYRVTAYTGEFILHDFYGDPYSIPLGGFLPYAGSTAPNSSFVLPFGQAISRTTYATLFSLVGSTYGSGDGSTTFNIPDLRGRIPAGKDNMGGSAASRMTTGGGGVDGLTLGAAGGAETQTLTQAQLPAVAPTFTGTAGTVNVNSVNSVEGQLKQVSSGGITIYGSGTGFLASTGSFTPAGTISNLGSGGSHTIMQPTFVCNYIMRVI